MKHLARVSKLSYKPGGSTLYIYRYVLQVRVGVLTFMILI